MCCAPSAHFAAVLLLLMIRMMMQQGSSSSETTLFCKRPPQRRNVRAQLIVQSQPLRTMHSPCFRGCTTDEKQGSAGADTTRNEQKPKLSRGSVALLVKHLFFKDSLVEHEMACPWAKKNLALALPHWASNYSSSAVGCPRREKNDAGLRTTSAEKNYKNKY